MDAEGELLHKLFKENNELRLKVNNLQRELFNKSGQIDNIEDELRHLRQALKEEREKSTTQRKAAPAGPRKANAADTASNVINVSTTAKTLAGETEVTDEMVARKNSEIKELNEEVHTLQDALEKQKLDSVHLEHEIVELTKSNQERKENVERLEAAIESMKKEEPVPVKVTEGNVQEVESLKKRLKLSDEIIEGLKRQIVIVANESNRKNNDLQNQLQGVESLVEGIKREYDEFLEITKIENDSYRAAQQAEFDRLRHDLEVQKVNHFNEKRKITSEFQGLLYSMQMQFDEYRTTAELLFDAEVTKLEDELSSQANRYEQEIMYIVQAKDKFYADMMVAKDAKIMNLIEGSDVQSIIQKHEMDIENIRKEHSREIDRVKTDQESEQKNVISLLQRQNATLETKCDKLQAHSKSLEARIKELSNSIEIKNRHLGEKEEQRLRAEQEHQKAIEALNAKINTLTQEKEHLRHKVIRMNLDAKGEGENTIDNMLKRITRETAMIHKDYDMLNAQLESTNTENEMLRRKSRDKEKLAMFLEKEVYRRNEEIDNLTRTFETFLESRSRQSRKESRLRQQQAAQSNAQVTDSAQPSIYPNLGVQSSKRGGGALGGLDLDRLPDLGAKVKFSVPESLTNGNEYAIEKDTIRTELNNGFAYLRRFKMLSRAFASGHYRQLAIQLHESEAATGAWQKSTLYQRLDQNTATNITAARLYGDDNTAPSNEADSNVRTAGTTDVLKAAVYQARGNSRPSKNIKLYEPKIAGKQNSSHNTAGIYLSGQQDNDDTGEIDMAFAVLGHKASSGVKSDSKVQSTATNGTTN